VTPSLNFTPELFEPGTGQLINPSIPHVGQTSQVASNLSSLQVMNDLAAPANLAKPVSTDPAKLATSGVNWGALLAALGGAGAASSAAHSTAFTDTQISAANAMETANAQWSSTPITGQMAAFGAQGGPLQGTYGNQESGASGDPWVYTHKPGRGKYRAGTAPGGWVILPPEVSSGDHAKGYVPPGISLSTVYFLTGPGAYFGAGIPEVANGTLQDGWSWGMDSATGDLIFRSHVSSAAADDGFMLDVSAQNFGFRSNTDYWGMFDHAISAARTWTMPDRSGTVVVGVSGTYTPTNVSTDRSYDADSTTLAEVADVLGTLIQDLQSADVIQ